MSRTEKILRRWRWWVALMLVLIVGSLFLPAFVQWRTIRWVESIGGKVRTEPGWLRLSTPESLVRKLNNQFGEEWSIPFDRVGQVDFLSSGGFDKSVFELARLRGFKKLGFLAIESVSDEELDDLRDFPALKTLLVYSSKLSAERLPDLEELPALENLSLFGRLTDAHFAALGKLERPEMITLRSSVVTDEGLRHLTGNDNLVALYLTDNQNVTAEGVMSLVTCPNLKWLSLTGTSLNDEEVDQILKALPGCTLMGE